MNLTRKPTSVLIEFSPTDYWLRKNEKDPEWMGEYMLTHRIDMSYKGKDPQEGSVVLYLTNEQAQVFRDAGFYELA